MNKFILILCAVILLFASCKSCDSVCEICGEFTFDNFSKNEQVRLLDQVSSRRTISISATKGADYYSNWKWAPNSPTESWSSAFENQVNVVENKFSIQSDGNWSWTLITINTSSTKNGKQALITQFNEGGTWTYLGDNAKRIALTTTYQNELNNGKKKGGLNHFLTKHFEVVNNEIESSFTLKSLRMDETVAHSEHTYSLTTGEIVMSYKALPVLSKLAFKQK